MRRLILAVTTAALAIGLFAGPASARTAPAPNLVDVAIAANADGDFDTLIAAVLAADPAILATLTRQRQLTVFAPTDAAFAKLGLNAGNVASLGEAGLARILAYHVAPGRRDAASVLDSTRIRTLQGGSLRVSVTGAGAFVNDARIIATDIPASNGIIHVIDSVLLPGS